MSIDNPEHWRISKSGLSIKKGWEDSKEIIARYPGSIDTLDPKGFKEWMVNAQAICNSHNGVSSESEELRELNKM